MNFSLSFSTSSLWNIFKCQDKIRLGISILPIQQKQIQRPIEWSSQHKVWRAGGIQGITLQFPSRSKQMHMGNTGLFQNIILQTSTVKQWLINYSQIVKWFFSLLHMKSISLKWNNIKICAPDQEKNHDDNHSSWLPPI